MSRVPVSLAQGLGSLESSRCTGCRHFPRHAHKACSLHNPYYKCPVRVVDPGKALKIPKFNLLETRENNLDKHLSPCIFLFILRIEEGIYI